MTLRHAKSFLRLLFVAVFFSGSIVLAQENVIEVQVESLQVESIKKFLKEHRQETRKTKTDLNEVVKEFREDFKNIKREQTRTLKVRRKYKPQVLTQRKDSPKKKKISRRPQSLTDPDNSFPEQEIFTPRKTRDKENLLNLNERQRRAKIENVQRAKLLRAQNSKLGRLKVEMEKEPLKSHQVKLAQFSKKIRKLLKELEGGGNVQRTVFFDLGNTYLESHSYLSSLTVQDRWKLTRYASQSGTILGSQESALWILKMVLARNPNDPETNFLLGKILSEMGERDLALRRARNAGQLFVKNGLPEKAVQTRSFIESLQNSLPQ